MHTVAVRHAAVGGMDVLAPSQGRRSLGSDRRGVAQLYRFVFRIGPVCRRSSLSSALAFAWLSAPARRFAGALVGAIVKAWLAPLCVVCICVGGGRAGKRHGVSGAGSIASWRDRGGVAKGISEQLP